MNYLVLGDEKMLSFVLCDDNITVLNKLSQMLENILMQYDYDTSITYKCTNANDLMKYIEQHTVDVLFLDINLKNKLSGLDIAEKIRETNKEMYIIFTTGHLEYALVAYKYKTFDYIPKPFISERLELTISRLFDDIKSNTAKFIKIGNSPIIIKEEDILYIRKDNMKSIYHTHFNDYSAYIPFNKIEAKLPENFIRCHKSYIVNIDMIEHIDINNNTIYLMFNNICPIGPKYKNNLMEVLNNYEYFSENYRGLNEPKRNVN